MSSPEMRAFFAYRPLFGAMASLLYRHGIPAVVPVGYCDRRSVPFWDRDVLLLPLCPGSDLGSMTAQILLEIGVNHRSARTVAENDTDGGALAIVVLFDLLLDTGVRNFELSGWAQISAFNLMRQAVGLHDLPFFETTGEHAWSTA